MVQSNKDATRKMLPKLLDIIDLTEDSSMAIRNGISRKKVDCSLSGSTSDKSSHRDAASNRSIVRRRNSPRETARNTTACNDVTSMNETINLDDTILVKDDDKRYAVTSDRGELTSLKCPICFELLSSEMKPTTTRCGHVFCAKCIETYVPIRKKCPTCNSSITLKSCTRLFL